MSLIAFPPGAPSKISTSAGKGWLMAFRRTTTLRMVPGKHLTVILEGYGVAWVASLMVIEAALVRISGLTLTSFSTVSVALLVTELQVPVISTDSTRFVGLRFWK